MLSQSVAFIFLFLCIKPATEALALFEGGHPNHGKVLYKYYCTHAITDQSKILERPVIQGYWQDMVYLGGLNLGKGASII